MREIVFVIDNVHLDVKASQEAADNWAASSKAIETIKNEIPFYKNLSFKVINIDKDALARKDISVVGINSFPWLRIFEDGKIIDDWNIQSGLREEHWDKWSKSYGIQYTLEELNALNQSEQLRLAEENRIKAELALAEQKKLLEKTNNERIALELQQSKWSNIIKWAAGGAIALFVLPKLFKR